MNDRRNALFVAWERHRRNQSVSIALGIPLYVFDYDHLNPLIRYFLCGLKTLLLIVKAKPRLIICQNPSLILALLLVSIKPLFRYILVVDAHNAGVFPDKPDYLLLYVLKTIHKKSDLTIITNTGLAAIIEAHKGTPFVLPDPLPELPGEGIIRKTLEGRTTVCFICSFGSDEPFAEVFEAAELLPASTILYVTGRFPSNIDKSSLSPNIRSTGFLPEPDFWTLISSVDMIMDLTTRDNCLVCGAYEGVAVKKPLIVSDTTAIKQYFNSGAVYVQPDRASIAAGILYAAANLAALQLQISALNTDLQVKYEAYIAGFKKQVNRIALERRQGEVFI